MDTTAQRLNGHLQKISKSYPLAWKILEEIRYKLSNDKSYKMDWQDWCYCPLAGTYGVITGGKTNYSATSDQVADISRIGALAAWRMTKGIYRFDSSLREALVKTPLSGNLPTELFFRLPEWCVYIETPDLAWHGFFAHMEYDAVNNQNQLRLLLDCIDGNLWPMPIILGNNLPLLKAVEVSLHECFRDNTDEIVYDDGLTADNCDDTAKAYTPLISPMISLLLYLCSDEADYGERRPTGNPIPKKIKRGNKTFPANNSNIWEVGSRIGAAFRTAYLRQETDQSSGLSDNGHGRHRPHIRVAHWHTYRTGPGRKGSELHWIPPIAVNVEHPNQLPITIRGVKAA